MAATAAPKPVSTAPANPLEEALAKITGGALSKTSGTSPISYAGGSVRPPADTVSIIEGPEGTGMTKAEQLSAERAEAAEKLALEKFGYEKEQSALADVYRKAEAAREAEQWGKQFGLTEQTTGLQLAQGALGMETERQRQAQTAQGMALATSGEARAAQQWGMEQRIKEQQMALAAAENRRKAEDQAMKYGIFGSYENYLRGQQRSIMEARATGNAPLGSPESLAYRMKTYPNYQPSSGELANYKALGGKAVGLSIYPGTQNIVGGQKVTLPSSPSAGRAGFYEGGKWVYR